MSIAIKAMILLFSPAICPNQFFALSQVQSRRVKVEFRLADTTHGQGLIAANVPKTGQTIYLHKTALITNKDIIEARAGEDPYLLHHYQVTVVFTKRAAERMRSATQVGRGRRVVILVDGKVLSALSITAPIYDRAAITGSWTKEEAESLARALDPKPGAKRTDSSRVAAARFLKEARHPVGWSRRPAEPLDLSELQSQTGLLGSMRQSAEKVGCFLYLRMLSPRSLITSPTLR